MSILIKKSGLLASIQDLGRNGYRRLGINPNGAMDRRAARLINILLGNDENEAILEMHFPAPVIEFEADAIFAVGGANFAGKLNKTVVENWRPYFARKGSVLEFGEKMSGSRAYLTVGGGLAVERWLGSSSTNLRAEIGGLAGRSLRKGDRIGFNSKSSLKKLNFPYKISNSLIPFYSPRPTIRVVAGAEFEQLTAIGEQIFLNENFIISPNSDRMGFRLRGKTLYLLEKTELISSAVDFGTIQLLPDGQIIVLMADHQTTGGYPKIAHVASTDLPVLAQLGANDRVNFQLVSIAEAEDLTFELEKDLNLLKLAVKSKGFTET